MQFCPLCKADLVRQPGEDGDRLICSSPFCDYVYWNNPIPVVAGIVELEGRIVLAHNVAWPPHMYSIITGFLEVGEVPSAGVIRETHEELNLEAFEYNFIGHYPFPQMNQLIIAYHLKAAGEIILNEELDDYKLVRIHELKPWDYGTGPAIRDFLKTAQHTKSFPRSH